MYQANALRSPAEPLAAETGESAHVYRTFVLCLLLISVPIKNFAYLVPPVYLACEIAHPRGRVGFRSILLLCSVAAVSGLAVLWDAARGQNTNLPGILVGLLTYLPIVPFLCERYDREVDEEVFQKIIRVTAWFVIVQSIIGGAQFAIRRDPDTVCGTFGLFDALTGSVTIAQVYFTFTLFGMILFLLLDPATALVKTAIVIGLLACVLAQSGHQTVFFMASLGLFGAIHVKRVRAAVTVVAVLGLVLFALVQMYPGTFEGTRSWVHKVALNRQSPKRMAAAEAVAILRHPKNFVIGTGLGQFCSRAALITSGEYLRFELPRVVTGQSGYFRTLATPRVLFDLYGEGSAVSKPYCSLMSAVVELGVAQSLLLLGVMAYHMRRNLRLMRNPVRRVGWTGLAANTGLALLLLCCTIENYLEFPQAIFMPGLLYVIAVSRANMESRSLRCDP